MNDDKLQALEHQHELYLIRGKELRETISENERRLEILMEGLELLREQIDEIRNNQI